MEINDITAIVVLKHDMPPLNELQKKAVERALYYLEKYGIVEFPNME